MTRLRRVSWPARRLAEVWIGSLARGVVLVWTDPVPVRFGRVFQRVS